jgi:ketosteroid isomerase-like protein
MSIALKERIFDFYQAFSDGRIDRLSELFDDNIDFVSNAPIEVFPYLGRRVGKAEVLKALSRVHQEFDAIEFIPLKINIEAESAGLIVSIRLTQRSSGRRIRLFAAHFVQFRNYRISEYRAFLDTFEAVQQVLGREFDVSSGSSTDPPQ